MPRLPIDYSKTIIYKICCKDINISEIYVGHTTDLTRRRQSHKNTCNNENNKDYNLKVYQFIRENGGWDNWSVIPIEEFPCENINQALIRERYYFEELKSSLNSDVPSRTKKEYYQINKEHIKEYHKEYYECNKEIINEKLKNRTICECGGKYTYNHKNHHFKTKKHQDYLTQTIPANNLT